ncbi:MULTISPECIES: LmeA family phospholipid-binding protein [unclassified Pseudonocardia]|uniref:LmeA family phospholipid-binding protein n=1 Tax=unclassified Pseudonocardia TaxID=2619320 RepID=UPI00094B1C96|nr:LmeA family phospholipid-binding protein [Pseudonocardia sp. Ae707_Ps1]OLM17086.1 hypothetical protein Ae707Ps1_1345c [Pseudonocardia sp. Ae707_Ps1]
MAVREPVSAPQGGPGVLESAALLASGTGPGGALLLRALIEAVRFRYLGRETTLGGTLRLVPTAIGTSGIGTRALTTGRLDVRLAARDVVRPGLRVRDLTVSASDVRLRPALTPELVTGPVEIAAVLDPDWVTARLREHAPDLDVTVDADGVPRARLRRHPGLGAAELAVAVEGHTLSWKVAALTVAGRRVGPPRSDDTRRSVRALLDRSPLRAARSGRVVLAGLPPELHLHGVGIAPDGITVRGRLASWRRPVPPTGIDDVLRGARSLFAPGR